MSNLTHDPTLTMAFALLGVMALTILWQISRIFFKKAEKLSVMEQRQLFQSFLDGMIVDPPTIDLDNGVVSLRNHMMVGDDTEQYRMGLTLEFPLEDCTKAYFPENALAKHVLDSWYDLRDEVEISHSIINVTGCPNYDDDGDELSISDRVSMLTTCGNYKGAEWRLEMTAEDLSRQLQQQHDNLCLNVTNLQTVANKSTALLEQVRDLVTQSPQQSTKCTCGPSQGCTDCPDQEWSLEKLEKQVADNDFTIQDLEGLWSLNQEEKEIIESAYYAARTTKSVTPGDATASRDKMLGMDPETARLEREEKRQQNMHRMQATCTEGTPKAQELPPKDEGQVYTVRMRQLSRVKALLEKHGLKDPGTLDDGIKAVLDHYQETLRNTQEDLGKAKENQAKSLEELAHLAPYRDLIKHYDRQTRPVHDLLDKALEFDSLDQELTILEKTQLLVDLLESLKEEMADQVTCLDCGLSQQIKSMISEDPSGVTFKKGTPTHQKIQEILDWYRSRWEISKDFLQHADDTSTQVEEVLEKMASQLDKPIQLDPQATLAENVMKVILEYKIIGNDSTYELWKVLDSLNNEISLWSDEERANLTKVTDSDLNLVAPLVGEVVSTMSQKILAKDRELNVVEDKLVASDIVREYHAERIRDLQNDRHAQGDYQLWKQELEALLDKKLDQKSNPVAEVHEAADKKFMDHCVKVVEEETSKKEVDHAVADAVEMIYDEVKKNTSLGLVEGRYNIVARKKEEILNRIRNGDHRKK